MASEFGHVFPDPASTELYTLSLHDALPILASVSTDSSVSRWSFSQDSVNFMAVFLRSQSCSLPRLRGRVRVDRKSTRLNSSHGYISYAVFCLKKKKKKSTASCSKTVTAPNS